MSIFLALPGSSQLYHRRTAVEIFEFKKMDSGCARRLGQRPAIARSRGGRHAAKLAFRAKRHPLE
jgi:hypothetical protein